MNWFPQSLSSPWWQNGSIKSLTLHLTQDGEGQHVTQQCREIRRDPMERVNNLQLGRRRTTRRGREGLDSVPWYIYGNRLCCCSPACCCSPLLLLLTCCGWLQFLPIALAWQLGPIPDVDIAWSSVKNWKQSCGTATESLAVESMKGVNNCISMDSPSSQTGKVQERSSGIPILLLR